MESGGQRRNFVNSDHDMLRPGLERVGSGQVDEGDSIWTGFEYWGGEEKVWWWRQCSVRKLTGEDEDGGDDVVDLCSNWCIGRVRERVAKLPVQRIEEWCTYWWLYRGEK